MNDFPSDHGGNHLLIGGVADRDLHSHWDNDLVGLAANGANVNTFASSLKAMTPVDPMWKGQGQFLTWAKQWATIQINNRPLTRTTPWRLQARSVMTQRQSRRDLPSRTVTTTTIRTEMWSIPKQLVKAGFRLAKLLEAIFN